MAKRGVIIGIGTVLLVIGLTGLGLLETGVIYPTGPTGLPEVKQPEQAAGSTQGARSPGNQTVQQPAPGSQSGGTPCEKPGTVSQAGNGERLYPKQDPLAQPNPSMAAPETAGGAGSRVRNQKFDENRLRALLKSESKHYAGETSTSRYARNAPTANTVKPVVIRFNFDPAQGRRLDVARVHLGDRIRVHVRQVGQVDRRVYFTFSESLNSSQGAVLKLETMRTFEHPIMYGPDQGYYVIEIKIYPNNRWNISPRSFV